MPSATSSRADSMRAELPLHRTARKRQAHRHGGNVAIRPKGGVRRRRTCPSEVRDLFPTAQRWHPGEPFALSC